MTEQLQWFTDAAPRLLDERNRREVEYFRELIASYQQLLFRSNATGFPGREQRAVHVEVGVAASPVDATGGQRRPVTPVTRSRSAISRRSSSSRRS
ncbi:hypothetical protein PINS_up016966 [Pythium insidiosum]|nr:hypothetical protein PINS_up016966 [Pythium insidiosum]